MSRDQKREPAEKVPDWCVVEALPEGATRIAPRGPACRWPISLREEWRVRPNFLEVRWSLLGFCRVRYYTGASLAVQCPRRSPALGRRLTIKVDGRHQVLAVGDPADVRALGAFLSRLTGWPLRSSQPGAGNGNSSALLPLAGLFILGGLMVAAGGFRQLRQGSALIQRLRADTGSDLHNAHPGTPVMATGRIEGAASEDRRLVLYDEYIYRTQLMEGNYWELSYSNRPNFWLSQDSKTPPVLGGPCLLIRPPYRWTGGERRYEGFRSGDLATVLGTVADDRDPRALEARLVFGGSASQLGQYLKQAAMLNLTAGFGSVIVGSFLVGVMQWLRRHPRAWRDRHRLWRGGHR